MDSRGDALNMADLVGAGFTVLADASGEVVRRYGLYDLLDDGVSAPATFIVGPDRTILWRQVGRDISDRPSADQILSQLDRL
jgi:peroxiredoxin